MLQSFAISRIVIYRFECTVLLIFSYDHCHSTAMLVVEKYQPTFINFWNCQQFQDFFSRPQTHNTTEKVLTVIGIRLQHRMAQQPHGLHANTTGPSEYCDSYSNTVLATFCYKLITSNHKRNNIQFYLFVIMTLLWYSCCLLL